jgi:hypothetical protein
MPNLKILFFTCEIVERLTKGESKVKERNKTHEESYIVIEVGGRRWGGSHGLSPRMSAGLSPKEEN